MPLLLLLVCHPESLRDTNRHSNSKEEEEEEGEETQVVLFFLASSSKTRSSVFEGSHTKMAPTNTPNIHTLTTHTQGKIFKQHTL